MRTLIVSDLHLGNGGPYDVFAGGEALPALLDAVATGSTNVLVNGDGLDFLMNEDPLELDAGRAAHQAAAIAGAPASAAVLRALGRVLARGGEVTFRLGNHDVELALPEVQSVLRDALEQPPDIAARLGFQLGDAPAILEVGGARILVTHGEHDDAWNQVSYDELGRGIMQEYTYSAGSALVKRLLNPITRDFGMRFVNLLKPDFQGGVLTALAVAPAAMKVLFQRASIDIAWQLLRKAGIAAAFDDADETLGLADRLLSAGLDRDESDAVAAAFGDGPAAFSEEDEGILSRASLKIAKCGLRLYAGLHRRLSGEAGEGLFRLEPDGAEWRDAGRLARKFQVGAVVTGHTHAARWKAADGLVLANSGTWIWLMRLPPSDATDEEWADFVVELRNNPGLAPGRQRRARTFQRLTAVLVEPARSGAVLSLVEWDGEVLTRLGGALVAKAGVS